MTVEAFISARLEADAGVGAICADRIYPAMAPQSAVLPFITYIVISEPHLHHMGGASGLAMPRVQVDCFAATSLQAASLGEAVRASIQGFRGTVAGVVIRKCHLVTRTTSMEGPSNATDVPVYRVTMDYEIAHATSVP